MKENVQAIILAAGKGRRMRNDYPKCGHVVCGKTMINRIVEELESIGIEDIIIVVGYKKEIIIELTNNKYKYVVQEEQRGTGDAIRCVKEVIKDNKFYSLILLGDMPFVSKEILNNLIEESKTNDDFYVVTNVLDNPTGYGRIIKDNNYIKRIIEEDELTDEEKKIKEVNTGIYLCNTSKLYSYIESIKNDNANEEFYLTDIFSKLGNEAKAIKYINDDRLIGINDYKTLMDMECKFSKKGRD